MLLCHHYLDLSRMYKLLKPLPKGLDIILSEFEKYIANTGLAKVKAFYTENVSTPNILMRNLFECFLNVKKYICCCFAV